MDGCGDIGNIDSDRGGTGSGGGGAHAPTVKNGQKARPSRRKGRPAPVPVSPVPCAGFDLPALLDVLDAADGLLDRALAMKGKLHKLRK